MYAGERKDLVFTVSDMASLTGYTASFSLRVNDRATIDVVTKTSTITIAGTNVTVPLLKVDTIGLSGNYYYECEIIDSSSEYQVIAVGNITIG